MLVPARHPPRTRIAARAVLAPARVRAVRIIETLRMPAPVWRLVMMGLVRVVGM